MLKVGAAQVCITPPIGVELVGYGMFLRRRSRSIHDDLYASALVFDDGNSRVAVVTADVISFGAATVDRIRCLAAEATGIPASHILISCTHSHTSPTTNRLRGCGEVDEGYVAMLARYVAGAIDAANEARVPARVGWGAGVYEDLAWNRVGRPQDLDASVQVLRVDAVDGGTLALLVNYACHPVMLGPLDAISGDYPGALCRHLSAAYEGATVLFANGACGDIDPVSNRDRWGKATFDDIEQAGAGLARAAAAVADQIVLRDDVTVSARQDWVDLPWRLLSEEQIGQDLASRIGEVAPPEDGPLSAGEIRRQYFWHRWAGEALAAVRSGAATPVERVEVQALHIGGVALVALPGEIFTAFGQAIKARSSAEQTFVISYANGNVGYIATQDDYDERRYASSMAYALYGLFQFEPEVGPRLVDAAAALVDGSAR